jgi:hypothetical protein
VSRSHARAPLPEGQHVHVVVDPDRGAVAGGEALSDRIPVPAGHDRRGDGTARLELDRPRDADADAPQVAGDALCRGQQRFEQDVHPVQAAVRSSLDPGRLVVMTKDPAVQGGHRDIDAGGAQVRHEEMASIGPERQLAGRPPTRRWTDFAFSDQPALHELADALRDDRSAQARVLDDLRPGPGVPVTDGIQDRHQGIQSLGGQRRGTARVHGSDDTAFLPRHTSGLLLLT